jgi:hypothetical protein
MQELGNIIVGLQHTGNDETVNLSGGRAFM